jgi:hypothetical protein
MKGWLRFPELQIDKLKFTEIFNELFKFSPGEMVTRRALLRIRLAKKEFYHSRMPEHNQKDIVT